MDKKERNVVVAVVVVLMLAFVLQNSDLGLSGHASKAVELTRELEMEEYSFQIGMPVIVEGRRVTLIGIGDNEEVIVDVSGVQKGISQYQGRVVNGLQVENVAVGEDNAILRILNLEAGEDFCVDSDEGDIYLKGECRDRFYPDVEKALVDFCDFSYLREFNCGYDTHLDEIHCLKHIVECVDGCRAGACVVVG